MRNEESQQHNVAKCFLIVFYSYMFIKYTNHLIICWYFCLFVISSRRGLSSHSLQIVAFWSNTMIMNFFFFFNTNHLSAFIHHKGAEVIIMATLVNKACLINTPAPFHWGYKSLPWCTARRRWKKEKEKE